MNWAQSALVCLLWLLYWSGSTHRPHMYPTPAGLGDWVWSEGAPGQYRPCPPPP